MNFETSNEQNFIAEDDQHHQLPFITGPHVGGGGGGSGGYGWPLYVPNVPQPPQQALDNNVPCWTTTTTTPQVSLFEEFIDNYPPVVVENEFVDSDLSSPPSSAFNSPDFQTFLTENNQDDEQPQQQQIRFSRNNQASSRPYLCGPTPSTLFSLSPPARTSRGRSLSSRYATAEQVDRLAFEPSPVPNNTGSPHSMMAPPPHDGPMFMNDNILFDSSFLSRRPSSRSPTAYDMDIIKKDNNNNNNNNDPESLRNSLLNNYYRSFIDEHSILKVFSKRAKAKVATVNTLNASLARRRGPAKFTCTIDGCDADFTRKHNLENHIKAHCGVTDRICAVCGKGFTTIPVWKRHQKTCERSMIANNSTVTSSGGGARVVGKSGFRNPDFGSFF